MSSAERHAEFLAQRLRGFGLRIELARGGMSAEGELTLASTPFETLHRPLVIERARFYTLGHNRLKFFQPPVFFDLPAVDVTRCESAADVEAALRRTWAASLRDLGEALAWLQRLRAPTELVAGGARLRLVDDAAGAIEVRSPRELLVPSSGELSERSLTTPSERRFRPLASLESANELAISIASAMHERASRSSLVPAPPPLAAAKQPPAAKRARRVLAVTNSTEALAELVGQLSEQSVEIDFLREPSRALGAFRERSYELVFVDVHLGREDGFELAMRLRSLPGVEQLPIVLIDERESNTNRSAARDAGAALYAVKPLRWEEIGDTLLDLLDHAAYRRYRRFPARLVVRTTPGSESWDELTELVARGGICLRTRRDILPGAIERYRIDLPAPFSPIEVEGDVMSRATLPGYASVLAGIRFRSFLDEGEARWIRVIEALAERNAGASELGR
ncbi:MAG: response regulator [Myxococcota bacterium]